MSGKSGGSSGAALVVFYVENLLSRVGVVLLSARVVVSVPPDGVDRALSAWSEPRLLRLLRRISPSLLWATNERKLLRDASQSLISQPIWNHISIDRSSLLSNQL